MKTLKFWNGRHGRGGQMCIAAYSLKEAAQLYCEAQVKLNDIKSPNWIDKLMLGRAYREIKTYYGDCWGNSMADIKPERGVWYSEKDHAPIKRVI